MAKANPTRPDAPADERQVDVDDQGELLDPALGHEVGERGHGKRDFSDDVRSDTIGGIPDKDQ